MRRDVFFGGNLQAVGRRHDARELVRAAVHGIRDGLCHGRRVSQPATQVHDLRLRLLYVRHDLPALRFSRREVQCGTDEISPANAARVNLRTQRHAGAKCIHLGGGKQHTLSLDPQRKDGIRPQ